jgi:hypothetical protein
VTDRHPIRIDIGLIGHRAAMALPVDVHSFNSDHRAEADPRKKKRRPKAPFLSFRD